MVVELKPGSLSSDSSIVFLLPELPSTKSYYIVPESSKKKKKVLLVTKWDSVKNIGC